jgi:peroxiredoxin-like protein
MTNKLNEPLLFESRLNWLPGGIGILHAPDVNGTIHVATPHQFGGSGKEWSPEHFFLNAVISCYMSTFISLNKKANIPVTHFECRATGLVELAAGKYKFTQIHVYPKISVDNEPMREKAALLMKKTEQYCLISNSINAALFYHNEVLPEELVLHSCE